MIGEAAIGWIREVVLDGPDPLTLPPDPGDAVAVLQVDQPPSAGGRPHPPPDRTPEQDERVRERDEPGLGDLLGLQHEAGERLLAHLPAVEEEPDSPRAARARPAEVHRREPAAGHVDAGLLAHLAPARLPRRFPVRLHDTAGDRPAALVGRLED